MYVKNVNNTSANNMITRIILISFLLAFIYLLFFPLHAPPLPLLLSFH